MEWSHAFDFRICFGKTLIALDFDEKLSQSIAQLCNIMCQKTLPLYFVVGQVLSISGCDLENGRMLCKQKSCIKKTWQ